METMLLIIVGIAVAALLLAHPATPRQSIIYVPLTVEAPQGSNLGCLPLLIVAILALVLLGGGLG